MSALVYEKQNISIRVYEAGAKIFDEQTEIYIVVEHGKMALKDMNELATWHENGNCLCCKRKDS